MSNSDQELIRSKLDQSFSKLSDILCIYSKEELLSFTQISSTPTSQYSDSKVVAEGEESTFRFTPPSSE